MLSLIMSQTFPSQCLPVSTPLALHSALQHLSVAAVARETAAATALSKDYAVWMLLRPLYFVAHLLPHPPHLIILLSM